MLFWATLAENNDTPSNTRETNQTKIILQKFQNFYKVGTFQNLGNFLPRNKSFKTDFKTIIDIQGMNSSALGEWPLSREWTQIKINNLSHHGDTTQCTPGALPRSKDRIPHHHFTLPIKWRLNVARLNILGQSDCV